MAVVFIQLDVVRQLAYFTVDAHPSKSLCRQATDQLGVGALFAPHHRSQQLIPDALRQQQNVIDHFVDALGFDRAAALGAMGFTSTSEQQTEVILDLGDGSNR